MACLSVFLVYKFILSTQPSLFFNPLSVPKNIKYKGKKKSIQFANLKAQLKVRMSFLNPVLMGGGAHCLSPTKRLQIKVPKCIKILLFNEKLYTGFPPCW